MQIEQRAARLFGQLLGGGAHAPGDDNLPTDPTRDADSSLGSAGRLARKSVAQNLAQRGQKVARPAGLEPTTLCLEGFSSLAKSAISLGK